MWECYGVLFFSPQHNITTTITVTSALRLTRGFLSSLLSLVMCIDHETRHLIHFSRPLHLASQPFFHGRAKTTYTYIWLEKQKGKQQFHVSFSYQKLKLRFLFFFQWAGKDTRVCLWSSVDPETQRHSDRDSSGAPGELQVSISSTPSTVRKDKKAESEEGMVVYYIHLLPISPFPIGVAIGTQIRKSPASVFLSLSAPTSPSTPVNF